MDTGTRRPIGSCIGLPFSRWQAEQIRQEFSLQRAPLASLPFSAECVRLREMAWPTVMQWPPVLPPVDPRGNDCVPKFIPWHKATHSKVGVAGTRPSLKAGGNTVFHSHLEEKLLFYFEMCPLVVEIRAQYPVWEYGRPSDCDASKRRMRKSDVLTIDYLLTIVRPDTGALHYHGVSGKPSGKILEHDVVKRHEKEARLLADFGMSHEVMSEMSVSPTEYLNCARLCEYMSKTSRSQVGQLAPAAKTLALALTRTSASGSLDRVLGIVGRRLGHNLNSAYRLFAIANFLGALRWNHWYKLSPSSPMRLVR